MVDMHHSFRPEKRPIAEPHTGRSLLMSGAQKKSAKVQTNCTCPSAVCEPGAIMLGFKTPQGRILNLRIAMAVDEKFVKAASELGPPERRMRFASPCTTDECAQWTGAKCRIIERALDNLRNGTDAVTETLPSCPIRKTCRWYRQSGASACAACETIVADPRQN